MGESARRCTALWCTAMSWLDLQAHTQRIQKDEKTYDPPLQLRVRTDRFATHLSRGYVNRGWGSSGKKELSSDSVGHGQNSRRNRSAIPTIFAKSRLACLPFPRKIKGQQMASAVANLPFPT